MLFKKIISDTSKFEKLNEDPTLKREVSLQRFLRKLKQKTFFNENEYDKLFPSGSAPALIYGTPEMLKLRMQIFPEKILVSYDVTSLFANSPLQ